MSYIDKFIRKTVVDIKQCIHGGRIWESAGITENPVSSSDHQTENKPLDFSANFNPMGPPERNIIKQIASSTLENIDSYPDNRYLEFREAAAGFAGVSPENIIPANGSSELIRIIAETILEGGDTVILPQPTFSEYELNIRLMGAVPENIEYRNVYQDLRVIDDELLARSKAVFLCNPNNPTGTLIAASELGRLADACRKHGTFLVIDEAFIELSDPAESMAKAVSENPFIIIMRSLTKEFAIPGIRIGYGIMHPELAYRMENIRTPWNMGTIPAAVGTYLMDTYSKDRSFLDGSRELIAKEREWLMERLSLIRGFTPIPSDTNFILVKIRDFGMDSGEITRLMLNQGILIRDCESFMRMGGHYIRVAVRKRDENQKLIDAFATSVTQWGKELAEKKIDEALHQGKIASRTNCEYYPCHFDGQDCTFCFCPFYPCGDERTGGHMVVRRTGGEVWSCAGCDLVHRPVVANSILEALMACDGTPDDIQRIWKKVMEPLL